MDMIRHHHKIANMPTVTFWRRTKFILDDGKYFGAGQQGTTFEGTSRNEENRLVDPDRFQTV
jgi:hypothetical protein